MGYSLSLPKVGPVLLTLSTTHRPATDLGFLLHKNPARAQSFDLSFGRAHVVYPEAGEDRCTAALEATERAVADSADQPPAGVHRAARERIVPAILDWVHTRAGV